MIPYKKMYFHLFNRITDALEALEALERGEAERARAVLIAAQQEGEELYLSADDPNSKF